METCITRKGMAQETKARERMNILKGNFMRWENTYYVK